MTKKIMIMSLAASLALVSAFLYTGCEDDPTMPSVGQYFQNNPYQSAARPTIDTTLSIYPESASVDHQQQAVSFRVTGGNNSTYTWTTAVAANGTVTPAYPGAADATYTTLALDANTVIVYDSDGRSAAAVISVGGGVELAIVPNNRTIQAGSTPVFTVVGGTAPYTVSVGNTNLGTDLPAVGANGQFTYVSTPGQAGTQTLTVVDDNGNTAVASVSQVL